MFSEDHFVDENTATIRSQKWRSLGSSQIGVSVESFIGSRTKSYKIGSKCVEKARNLHTFKKFRRPTATISIRSET